MRDRFRRFWKQDVNDGRELLNDRSVDDPVERSQSHNREQCDIRVNKGRIPWRGYKGYKRKHMFLCPGSHDGDGKSCAAVCCF